MEAGWHWLLRDAHSVVSGECQHLDPFHCNFIVIVFYLLEYLAVLPVVPGTGELEKKIEKKKKKKKKRPKKKKKYK